MPTRPAILGSSSSSIKRHNVRAVLLVLLWYAPVSRVRIAQLTGLSTTTVTNLVAGLQAEGLVAEDGLEQDEQRGAGRPRVALRIAPEARRAVGIHIGVGSVHIAVTDLFGRPQREASLEHPLSRPALAVLDDIAAETQALIEDSGVDRRQIVGVGVGASGLVDPVTGVNVFAPNLNWRAVPLRDILQSRLRCSVTVDNNVRAMALAETLFGSAAQVSTLAFVYARVGVGAGFVLNGELYRGGAGAGEIGHMALLADGGDTCRCGSSGCLETLVAEPVIVRLAQERAAERPDSLLARHLRQHDGPAIERVLAAGRAGDPDARGMLEERARYMGIGLANLVNTLSPELIVLGGWFAQGQDLLFPVVQATLRRCAFADLGERVRLQAPTFGQQTGVIGAAALALDAFFLARGEGVE